MNTIFIIIYILQADVVKAHDEWPSLTEVFDRVVFQSLKFISSIFGESDNVCTTPICRKAGKNNIHLHYLSYNFLLQSTANIKLTY